MRTRSALVKVPSETSVADTRRALQDAGTDVVLVTYFGRDVGLITSEELDSPSIGDDEAVGDVVTDEIVHVGPMADYPERMAAYHAALWDSLRRRSPARARRLAAEAEGAEAERERARVD